ncbi:MAG: PTS system mannose/fructose/sorbose family transporter subunit IID [Gemmatimonadota bacterium]
MKEIPWGVRMRMLLRSFSVQGSWNYETLVGAGFAFTILPALRYLYGTGDERFESAVARHSELFNSHPYFATVAVGAVSRLEADAAEPIVIQRFKTALRGSLGSMGDRLFWSTWRPMSMLLALALFLAGAAWWIAVVTFLLVYNTLHLLVRVRGLRMGTESGLQVGRMLREAPLQTVIDQASRAACLLVGIAIVLWGAPYFSDPVAGLLMGAAILFGFSVGLRTRRLLITIMAGITALALAYGIIANGA